MLFYIIDASAKLCALDYLFIYLGGGVFAMLIYWLWSLMELRTSHFIEFYFDDIHLDMLLLEYFFTHFKTGVSFRMNISLVHCEVSIVLFQQEKNMRHTVCTFLG